MALPIREPDVGPITRPASRLHHLVVTDARFVRAMPVRGQGDRDAGFEEHLEQPRSRIDLGDRLAQAL